MPVHIGELNTKVTVVEGDLPLTPRQVEALVTIVVARIEHETTGEAEVTVKRFFRENGRVRLQPENPALDPIYPANLALEGVVTAVIRVL